MGKKIKKYYHISKNDHEVTNSILTNGLRCNDDGHIFIFENIKFSFYGVENTVCDHIASNQVFLDEYSLFEINEKGINNINPDNVGEITAKFQWIVSQEYINPIYIKHLGVFKTNYKSPFNQF